MKGSTHSLLRTGRLSLTMVRHKLVEGSGESRRMVCGVTGIVGIRVEVSDQKEG